MHMQTKIINLNEYETNIARLWKDAQKNNIKYLILVHPKPAFEVIPLWPDFMIKDTDEVPLDLHELEDWEITPELRAKSEASRLDPLSNFSNI